MYLLLKNFLCYLICNLFSGELVLENSFRTMSYAFNANIISADQLENLCPEIQIIFASKYERLVVISERTACEVAAMTNKYISDGYKSRPFVV